jgi:hypothetical protein
LEELRDKLRVRLLDARSAPAWEEADLVCDSKLFWRARMVSYVHWGRLNLRLDYELRRRRLVLPVLAIVLISIWPLNLIVEMGIFAGPYLWSPGVAAVAVTALVGSIVLERLLFGLRVRRGLVAGAKK